MLENSNLISKLSLTRAKIVEEGGDVSYGKLVYPFPKILLSQGSSCDARVLSLTGFDVLAGEIY